MPGTMVSRDSETYIFRLWPQEIHTVLGGSSQKSIRPSIYLCLQSSMFYLYRSVEGANAESQGTVWTVSGLCHV